MPSLTKDQIDELKKAFQVMDSNGDGVVTKEELSNLLKGLGEDVTNDIVDEMIKIADENGDGKIQFEEFCKAATEGNLWATKKHSPSSDKEPIQRLPTDKDRGTIWQIMKHVLRQIDILAYLS